MCSIFRILEEKERILINMWEVEDESVSSLIPAKVYSQIAMLACESLHSYTYYKLHE